MFTSFTTHTTGSAAVASVTFGLPRVATDQAPSAPLISTGSLQLFHTAADQKTQVHASAPSPVAFADGSVRSMAWKAYEGTPVCAIYAFGLYCMASVSNSLVASSGNCYLVGCDNSGGSAGANQVWIGKSASGITGVPVYLCATSLTVAFGGDVFWVPNTSFAMGLSWQVSGTGVTLQLLGGSAMGVLLSTVDASGAFMTTQGEGFWGHTRNAAVMRILIDNSIWTKIST